MTDKNIQIRDLSGNNLFPKTKGSLVFNNDNENLGAVEAGAQVNIIEAITLNGSAVTVSSKTAAITLPAAVSYTIEKLDEATSGYIASYQLCADGVGIADSIIDIPKDYLVKSASMQICAEAGVPATTPALEVGDPYLDFVINTKDSESSTGDSHIYINVKGLVDIYTEGNNIDITSNQISVDLTGYTKASSASAIAGTDTLNAALGKLEYKADAAVVANAEISAATKCKITYDAKGLVTAGADLSAADIPSLAVGKISAMTDYSKAASAAAIDVNDSLSAAIGKLEFKADAAVVANTAITGATKCKITYDNKGLVTAGADLSAADIPSLDSAKIATLGSYTKAASAAAIATTDTLNDALGKLEAGLDTKQATITGGATSIVSADLTASKVLVSDANGKVAVSDVTTTQLGNLITYVELSE